MVHSQWECYTHNGHVTFTMGMLHSQWASYIHNGHVTFQMGSLHSKWACYIPNGHVTFQMGTLHSKWACYIPNGHVTFQMGMSHSKWARYIPNGHVTFQMGTLHSKWAVTFQVGMLHSKGHVLGWGLVRAWLRSFESKHKRKVPSRSSVKVRLDTQPMGSVSLAITLIASILFSSSCIASYLRHGCTTGATEGWMALWCHPLLLYATITHAVYTQIKKNMFSIRAYNTCAELNCSASERITRAHISMFGWGANNRCVVMAYSRQAVRRI